MIERFLRSPLTMGLFLIGVGLVFALGIITEEPGISFTVVKIGFALFSIIYFALMIHHNRKHPHRKIRIFTYIPYELKEEDEGHQYITYRACRKVYIYYYFAIPAAIAFVTFFRNIEWMPVLILAVLGLGQYYTFWTEIKKLHD